jgi:hypothetical protein
MVKYSRSFILIIVCIAVLLAGVSSSAKLEICKKSGTFICSIHFIVSDLNPDSKPAIQDSTCKKFHESPAALYCLQLAHLFFHPPIPSYLA